jgi:hypothetical protein
VNRSLFRDPPRWARAALVGIVLVPIAVAIVRAMRADWFPIGDSAQLYTRARDVLTAHHPFYGSWTSASQSVGENMNNPGPMHDDLLAPVARMLPFSSAAALAVGLVNGLVIVLTSWIARVIGGWAMQRWMVLACALLVWIMGSELLIDIWQAHALLLPFVLMLLVTAGLGLGRWSLLPWAAGVATFLVQTHISYVYVLAVLVVAAAAFALATQRPIAWRRWRTAALSAPVKWTVAVLVVLWAQPVWEQLFGPGKGNLERLATNASGGDIKLGLSNAVRFSARILVRPPWDLRNGFTWLIPPTGVTQGADGPVIRLQGIVGLGPAVALLAALLALIAFLGWSARRRRIELTAACWVAGVTVAATPLCLAVVTVGKVGLAPHHIRWLWALGAFVTAVVLWGIVDLATARAGDGPRAIVRTSVAAALTVVLSLLAIPYLAQQQGPVADYEAMPALRKVMRDVGRLEGLDPVVYETKNLRIYEPYSSTVMLRMQELGIEFRVEDGGMVRQLGPRREAKGDEPTRVFQLERIDVFLYEGDDCLISRASALDADEERAAEEAADAVTADLVTGRLVVDPADVPAELRERLAAAVGGDRFEARNLVLDGSLLRADPPGLDDEVRRRLRLVDRWVFSTYALYATTERPCPE